jgi:hemerythrin-like metal-binding protein
MEFDGGWDLVTWGDEYITGNDGMDFDHQRLVALFNAFAMAVNAGHGDVVIRDVLDELTEYTRYHFSREEQLMQESGYPGYERHKKMHDTFIRQIDGAGHYLGVGGGMSAFLLSFLARWLGSHVLGADRELGHFLAGGDAAGH